MDSASHCRTGIRTAIGRLCATTLIPSWIWIFPNISTAADAAAYVPSAARRGELITLVRQDCGSCHGLTLKGGLGPALLPETLTDRPRESLIATILQGRTGSAMPPWHRFLTEQEAAWVVDHLQKGFPP